MRRVSRLRARVLATAALLGVPAAVGAAGVPPTTAGPVPAGEARAAGVAGGEAADAGDLLIVAGANTDDVLTEGDTNTVFSVRLPDGSTCPGDSANDDWRVQTFVVPAAADAGSLRYGATRPQGDVMYALYTTEGRPYAQVLLNQNPEPGMPGEILPMPAFSFAPFTPDLLPVGRYTVGVACSYYEFGERYWDVEIEMTEDRGVEPGQRRWRVIAPNGDATSVAPAPTDGGSGPSIVAVLIGGLVLAALVATVVLRRRRTPSLVKEYAR